jgi:3-phytase
MRARPIRRMLAALLCTTSATALGVVSPSTAATTPETQGPPPLVRFATFNASLNRNAPGQLIQHLSTPDNAQAATVAEIIQRARPDVLLINEFDFDADGTAAHLFQQNYLSLPHNGATPIEYPYRFVAPSNTGIPSGLDLNNDGSVGGPDDAFGFGFFPGQFGMAVYSMHPIVLDDVRTFQTFLWADMPEALLPDDPSTPDPADWFSAEEQGAVRLSSKSHWDLPVDIEGRPVHFLVSHPTPPVFDGPEDRNGRRNHDEIRFWADYATPGKTSAYIYDDAAQRGGLPPGARFVIAGDQNADPLDGDSVPGAAQLLLEHPRVNTSVTPASEGAVDATERQNGANLTHRGDPALDTADFADSAPGNLRVDYVLPSRPLRIVDAAVFWPTTEDPLFRLVGDFPFPSSDHRLVWIDVALPGGPPR